MHSDASQEAIVAEDARLVGAPLTQFLIGRQSDPGEYEAPIGRASLNDFFAKEAEGEVSRQPRRSVRD